MLTAFRQIEELLRKRKRFSTPVTGGKLLAASIRKLAGTWIARAARSRKYRKDSFVVDAHAPEPKYGSVRNPRNQSEALIAFFPSGCISMIFREFDPHATVPSEDKSFPASPCRSTTTVRKILTRFFSPFGETAQHQAPGLGENARI
jgi:hypothetical protein